MILLLAVVIGLFAGITRAWYKNQLYSPVHLQGIWLVFLAYLPQFFAFFLPFTRPLIPNSLIPYILVISQSLLLLFAWQNRGMPGMRLLATGLFLNFLVIALNGGMMPLSPQNAQKLILPGAEVELQLGQRVGYGKDVLLEIENTRVWFLSDIFTLPSWIGYRLAFSFGDILIALGAFWLFWSLGNPQKINSEV